jgi:hypothetical protein
VEEVLGILRFYDQLQLLMKQMNVTFQDFFTPGLFMSTSNAIVFILYVCIKLHSDVPMPGFAFFPMVLMDAVLVIGFDFAAAGFVYAKSKSVIGRWTRMENRFRNNQSNKLVKAKACSFPSLKLRFGMNFVDELTTLTILDYCLNQTVSLLLMT